MSSTDLLERSWAERAERVYPGIFGPLEPSIAPLDFALFRDMFGQSTVDPRWLHAGVMVVPPQGERDSWVYVSSGLSNPWEPEAPETFSGLGCDFVFQTMERADLPIIRLQHVIAFQLLLAADRYPGNEMLAAFHRLPLRGPIDFGGSSALDYLLVVPGFESVDLISLASGKVELFSLVGIAGDEAAFARAQDGVALVARFHAVYHDLVTRPERTSVF